MRFGVDVGGTFTDVVAVSTDGISVSKLRSVPGGVPPTLWKSLGQLGGTEGAADALIHGTTVATNVLLERTGGRVVLVTTAGFEDLLWLRRQDRAALYELSRDHPPPVVDHGDVIGARERVGVEGVIDPLAGEEIVRVVQEVARRSPDAIAICLLFAFRDPTHERGLAEALRSKLSTVPVACSHEVLPVFREYERASTTVAEAYLRPAVGAYISLMGREAGVRGFDRFRIMASNGGTMRVEQACARAASLALSGPAGGVEGARLVGAAVGDANLLTLDMGGTSADASVILDGSPLTEPGGAIGGIPLALPHILIETVGAGGGSVGWLDRGGALRVGPRSAGAVPGPACYSQGGEEPTVTDAALVLGWLDVEHPLADDLPLHRGLAERALAAVARAAGLSVERCAEGMIDIANAAMVRALRRVSVERGIDPRNMTLVAFGGAGPLFACRMAESLGMHRALIPPHPGVLSALGLASAPEKLEFVDSLHRSATELDARSVDSAFADLEANARRDLPGAELVRLADCRYPGQGYELTVPASGGGEQIAVAFHALHGERYGHADRDRPVDVVNVRLVAQRAADAVRLATSSLSEAPSEPIAHRAPLRGLPTGTQLRGPIMLDGVDATARIEPGWNGTVHESGTVILERA
jgi:N-methylhydantoinase A